MRGVLVFPVQALCRREGKGASSWIRKEGEGCAYIRRFPWVYAEGNFRIYRNIFSHMQKFIFVYTEISLRIYGSFPPYKGRFYQGLARPDWRSCLFPSSEGRRSVWGRSAKIGRWYLSAKRTVCIVPLWAPHSMTRSSALRAACRRSRATRRYVSTGVASGYSESTSPPEAMIRSWSACCYSGCARSRPVAMTAMVRPVASSAPWWAAASHP